MIHGGVLEAAGRAQSAGQPDVRRLSSAVSNVDGFTLVEGEATPLIAGAADAARHEMGLGKTAAGQRPRPSAGRPLDTIANLARSRAERTPRATRTPLDRTAQRRRRRSSPPGPTVKASSTSRAPQPARGTSS